MNKSRIFRLGIYLILVATLILGVNIHSPAAAQGGRPNTDGAPESGIGPGFLPQNHTLNPPGQTSFLSGPASGDPRAIALSFLSRNRDALGLSPADMAGMIVADQYTDDHNGVTHLYLQQRSKGIDVANANISINIARDGSVINVSSSFIPDLAGAVRGRQALSAMQAVFGAAQHLGLATPPGLRVAEQRGGPMKEVVFEPNGLSLEPIPARLVYQPVSPGEVRLAWEVEIYPPDARHYWNLRLDSETNTVLAQDDYSADSDLRTKEAGGVNSPARQPVNLSLASLESSDSYLVFELPKKSPYDGDRSLSVNPASGTASPYGWHDTNGQPGAEYTVTRGNNVFAYTDSDSNNKVDPGSSPDGGSSLLFDFPLDLAQQPSAYRPAAVTNLFYWVNIIHDVLVEYGFTEAAGNFQVANYTGYGKGEDEVQAEAQEAANYSWIANFYTPADGKQPRMQLTVLPSALPITVHVSSPLGAAGDYPASDAQFGPSLQTIGPLSGTAIIANDGAGASVTDACEPLVGFPSGNIAIVDRGTCFFIIAAKNAQDAGATAVIVANNAEFPFSMCCEDKSVNIPSAMVGLADGAILKAYAPLTLTMAWGSSFPDRDTALDSTIILHEYMHGVSNRLTGGPSKVNCLSNNEQMGEGWSDFLSLVFTAAPSDTGTTPRGIGNYLFYQPPTGGGYQPTPYTTDMSVNPSTYSYITANAGIHYTGYVWASMLWEVYWNLVNTHGFNPNIYESWQTGGNNLALQLVIDGLKLQTCHPGFVDGRDAILQADQALTGGANQCAIWKGFAKRGLGFSASQGSSKDVTDGTEAFDLPPACTP